MGQVSLGRSCGTSAQVRVFEPTRQSTVPGLETGAHVRPRSSTRMGSLPCSSASMSLGLQLWKAPLQMNRMWSVLILPCLVLTTLPSMMGKRSRCTPLAARVRPVPRVLCQGCHVQPPVLHA